MEDLREVNKFGCTYHGARLLYTVTYVPSNHVRTRRRRTSQNRASTGSVIAVASNAMTTEGWIFMVGFRVFDVGLLVVWLIWFFRLRDDDDDSRGDDGGGGGEGPGPRGGRDGPGGGGIRLPLGRVGPRPGPGARPLAHAGTGAAPRRTSRACRRRRG